jgi:plastocyanin
MHRSLGLLAITLAVAGVAACSDSSGPVETTNVSMQDQCDAASFNAALGAGTCSTQGSVTFAQFNAELNSSHQVAAWRYVPSTLEIHVGQAITAVNFGGETHTFTEVDQFGGGIVPSLNQASGNTTEAPECAQLTAADMVAPGAAFTADVATAADVGTERYQCCIHPWMRAVVTIKS